MIFQKFVLLLEAFRTIATKIATKELVYDQETKSVLARIAEFKNVKKQAASVCLSEFKDKPMVEWLHEAKGHSHEILAKLIHQAEAFVNWLQVVDFFNSEVKSPEFWQELRATGTPALKGL